jgi:excisionase family DNA binding protein
MKLKRPKGIKVMVSASRSTVTISPAHSDFITQQAAAEILNVSVPFLVNCLAEGELPFQEVGAQVLLLRSEVMAYRDRLDERSSQSLDEMVAISEELGLYAS